MRQFLLAIAAAGALVGVAGNAQAVVVNSNLQCSSGANPNINADTNGTATTFDDLSVSDVTLNSTNSSDCYGPFDGGPSGDAADTADVNTIFGPGFVLLDKSDVDVNANLSGINFEVTASGANAGTWTLTWTDTNGASPANLPALVDLVVLLKDGGQLIGLYLLQDFLLPLSPTNTSGTYDIIWNNPGGQQGNLSHLSLFGGNLDPVPTPVPEPVTLALIGAGLAGIGLIRRRRNKAA